MICVGLLKYNTHMSRSKRSLLILSIKLDRGGYVLLRNQRVEANYSSSLRTERRNCAVENTRKSMYKFVRIDRDKAKGLGVASIVSKKPGAITPTARISKPVAADQRLRCKR